MRTLFLSSSGLNEKTTALFWQYIRKEPINTKAIMVPSAAVGNDNAREGIIVCVERLMSMGIPLNNILIYNLTYLLSNGYKRTYSDYVCNIPVQFRLMSAPELNQYDIIVFCGGNAQTLLKEMNRTGFSDPFKTSNRERFSIFGNQRWEYDCSRKFCGWFILFIQSINSTC